ncbi:MAG: hypothetical protein HQK93_10205, partial [Nitrospirae bacterium]|nr:hypothetical protein [Nitrospirota bacterium]
MKKLLIILMTCLFIFTIALPVTAAETKNTSAKIAFIDVNKVLQESKTGIEALKTFNAFAMTKKDPLMAKAKEINDLQT